MIQRVICPFHSERTPSCVLYPNGYKCYGCGKSGPLTDLGKVAELAPSEVYKENLDESFQYIESLPVREIRGLKFPTDGTYYYVVWPDRAYYNRRSIDQKVQWGQKYKCPSGIARPLFKPVLLGSERRKQLIICEGEINALSVAQCGLEADIVSPGGAGNFYSKAHRKYLTDYVKYAKILLIADEDSAGAIACIELKSLLMPYIHDVTIKLMRDDANDWLVNRGKEALKEEILAALEMPQGLQNNQNPLPSSRGSVA